MTQSNVLPVGRLTPSPGLFVDRTEKSVVIGGLMELSGAEATPARALSIQKTINLILDPDIRRRLLGPMQHRSAVSWPGVQRE